MKKIIAIILALVMASVTALYICASSFKDVSDKDYYAAAAERMAKRGILSGYGDGSYHGGETVTRAQIAALVCKMLGKTDEAVALAGKTVFSDVDAGAWYTGYINYAVANKIIVGDGDGRFRPDDSVKYEEVIKVVVCVLGLDKNVKVNPSDWSKEYIEAANKAGLTKNLIGKKGTPMLRSDIAVICDAGMTLLDKAESTTQKHVSGVAGDNSPTETTAPESTTSSNMGENQLPVIWF